jgi:aspartate kinase
MLTTTARVGPAAPEAEGSSSATCADERLPIVTGYWENARRRHHDARAERPDFTATILGAAIGAEEIRSGATRRRDDGRPAPVPTAWPIAFHVRRSERAGLLRRQRCSTSTIVPAVRKGIPVKVLNTFRPEHPGTTILSKLDQAQVGVKSIAHHLSNYVVNIRSSRMLMGHGFLARLFGVFAENRVVVNMVSTSEVTVSVTVDSPRRLDAAVEALSKSPRCRSRRAGRSSRVGRGSAHARDAQARGPAPLCSDDLPGRL